MDTKTSSHYKKELFVMYETGTESYEQLSKRLNIPIGSIRYSVDVVKKFLKKQLQKDEPII